MSTVTMRWCARVTGARDRELRSGDTGRVDIRRVLIDLLRGSGLDQLSAPDHGDAVGEVEGFAAVVRDEEYARRAFPGDALQVVSEVEPRIRVQIRRGSSRKRISGSSTSARARATRWASPPDSSDTGAASRCGMANCSHTARQRIRDSNGPRRAGPDPARRCTRRSRSRSEVAETRRADAARSARSLARPERPRNATSPASGFSSMASRRSRVDLPAPLGPNTASSSPFRSSIRSTSTAVFPP